MKQVLQNLKDGSTNLADVPVPHTTAGHVLITTRRSLVSAGTERMLVQFGKANLIDKARQQPDKVKMVLNKARTDGVLATVDAVRSKLDQPIALGYCNVGRVAEVGARVEGFTAGDRVVSNGAHAEVVCVPRNLCTRIPDGVEDDEAAFTVLAAIGLQGTRLLQPTLGECVAVTGLGLIGLLTVQILRAQGCRVLGIDYDPARLALAREFGADTVDLSAGEDPEAAAEVFSRGRGVDGVILTASTQSSDPVTQAAHMCRKRGRIVLVGVTGLELSRADFYEKELTFQVSCSYGPGRYDASYEEEGHDYPVGFVRWTEQRNFEAVLDLMDSGALDLTKLISHRFKLAAAIDAYALLDQDTPSLGILLQYPEQATALDRKTVPLPSARPSPGRGQVAFIGAGNYAGRVLIPAFKAAGAGLRTVVSSGGVSSVHHGSKHGFAQASTDFDATLSDDRVDTLVIATRHNLHAAQVLAGLRAGKHIFCEKPLCLTLEQLDEIQKEAESRPQQALMVGFNRRFAPHVVRVKELLQRERQPATYIMTVNAGAIPGDHWTQDLEVGGGRIVGEGCHFIDLLRYLVGAPITGCTTHSIGQRPGTITNDKATLTLEFEDGSLGTIHYFANGDSSFPKERLEVFVGGKTLRLDNYRKLEAWGFGTLSTNRAWQQDKGQIACVAAFVEALLGGKPAPITREEIFEVSRVSIEAQAALGPQG